MSRGVEVGALIASTSYSEQENQLHPTDEYLVPMEVV